MKTGRPRQSEKRESRKRTVRLTEAADICLINIKKLSEDFEFSNYVSRCLIRDYGSNRKIAKQLVALNNKKIRNIEKENEIIRNNLREIEKGDMNE